MARTVPPGPFRVRPSDDRLSWTGRVLFEDGIARFDWPGVSLSFRFRGSSFTLDLSDGNNDYRLELDGRPLEPWRTRPGETGRTFGGLSAGEHAIRLSKRTEASYGVASFGGVLFPAGAELLSPPPPSERRIEFVGDSLACGYGVEGNDPQCPGCRALEDVHLSYAGLTAAALRADARYIAWSGKGVLRNYGDPASRSTQTLPDLHPRTLAGRPEPREDPSGWIPHLVVLQCGGNDFSTEPRPDLIDWAGAYSAFALRLLTRYPDVRLLCVSSAEVPKRGIEAAIEEVRSRSGQAVPLVRWDKRNIRELGCDYHPGASAQRQMAEPVLGAVRDLMGW